LRKKAEEIAVEGEVLDKIERQLSKGGSSDHFNIPSDWTKRILRGLNRTLVVFEGRLIHDEEGNLCIVFTKLKREGQE